MSPHQHASSAPVEVLDPVCGMTIAPNEAVGHVEQGTRVLPVAAAALYRAFGLLLSPIIAAAAMSFSSV
jgi:hypothetical protein